MGLAAGGTALIVASIPFQRAFRRNAQEAVDAFNKDIPPSSHGLTIMSPDWEPGW